MFFNSLFPFLIGLAISFVSSYSIKNSYSRSKHFDNFDIVMMIVPPFISYLLAEAFSLSGLLSLISCSFFQSIYAKKNLQHKRSLLVDRTFRALSYSCRSISDLLVGILLPLTFSYFRFESIRFLSISLTLVLIPLISFGGTYLANMCTWKKY